MKIGITCYPTYGGSGIVATELGLELAQRGHEVHFITYASPIRLDTSLPGIHYHEVEVSSYPLFQYPPYCLALAARMAEVAENYGLDLHHVHYAIPHSVSALLARGMLEAKRRVPFITTLHGTDITLVGADRSYHAITKYSIEQSDGITTISDNLRQETVRVFDVPNEIRVVHNFVDLARYRQREVAGPGRVLLHISNFRPVKRVLDCIRVFAAVRRHTDAELWMAGDGPDRSPAERLAHELGVAGHVRFLGKQDRIHLLIPQADVLLLPSEMESFGLAALEAMACGVPPVATRVGGTPELITDGVDGYLCAVGDTDLQAERAIALLTDETLRHRMADAARLTAETRFSTTQVIPQYLRYYEDVLSFS